MTDEPIDLGNVMVGKLRLGEDGAITNRGVELYALLLAEGTITQWAAWTVTHPPKDKKKPGSTAYRKKIDGSAVFKQRLEALVEERQNLEGEGTWGRIEWQANQLYRRGVALNDTALMLKATDLLVQVAKHNDAPAPKEPKPEGDGKGRGAPTAPSPADALAPAEGEKPISAARHKLLTN